MEGQMRRDTIIKMLGEKGKPLSGTELAKELGVSRQVIVQDIALLRAVNKNILSTNKGYVLYDPSEEKPSGCGRIYCKGCKEQGKAA